MDPELPKDFKEFLSLLRVHGVEYLLIGAYAVGYYGYPRATKDLDIWIAVAPENAARLVTCLKEFGFDTPDYQRNRSSEKRVSFVWGLSLTALRS